MTKYVFIIAVTAFSFNVFAQNPDFDQYFSQSNCRVKSNDFPASGVALAFQTKSEVTPSDQPFVHDFPLNQCLDEVRLAIISKLGDETGQVLQSDRGIVEFGEQGALSRCSYRVQKGAQIPTDLMINILKYEGVLKNNGPSENYNFERLRSWAKAIEDIVIIDCLTS